MNKVFLSVDFPVDDPTEVKEAIRALALVVLPRAPLVFLAHAAVTSLVTGVGRSLSDCSPTIVPVLSMSELQGPVQAGVFLGSARLAEFTRRHPGVMTISAGSWASVNEPFEILFERLLHG